MARNPMSRPVTLCTREKNKKNFMKTVTAWQPAKDQAKR
jgi:hypothetical protein